MKVVSPHYHKREYHDGTLATRVRTLTISDHNKEYNTYKRDPEANKFYQSRQWQSIREFVYTSDMASCQVCGQAVTDRKIVDHIKPRRLCNHDEALDADNLWTLCYFHHSIKTKMEQKMSDNQLKHCSREWWRKTLVTKRQ